MRVAIILVEKHVRQVCKHRQFAQTEIVEFQPILACHPQRLYSSTCGTIGRLSWNAVISVDVDFFRLPSIRTIVAFGRKFQLNFVTTNDAERDRYRFVLIPSAVFLYEEKLNCIMTSFISNFVTGILVHTVHSKKKIWMVTRQLQFWAVWVVFYFFPVPIGFRAGQTKSKPDLVARTDYSRIAPQRRAHLILLDGTYIVLASFAFASLFQSMLILSSSIEFAIFSGQSISQAAVPNCRLFSQ